MPTKRLQVWKDNGTPITETGTAPDSQGNPYFILSPNIDNNYHDLTDTVTYTNDEIFDFFQKYWRDAGCDIICATEVFDDIVTNDYGAGNAATGWAALSSARKDICVEMNVGTLANQIAHSGIDTVISLHYSHQKELEDARRNRMDNVEVQMDTRLGHANGQIAFREMIQEVEHYIFDGALGTTENGAGVYGVLDYIYGRAGTPYANAGLLQKGWVPTGFTMQALCDHLAGILRDGSNVLMP